MDYIMIDEPENGHKSLVFRYKNPLFSNRITLYDIEDRTDAGAELKICTKDVTFSKRY